MYIPMPFPRCPRCNKVGSSGFHRNCGGELEIDPEIEMVFCPKCRKKWKVMESKYYCSCGKVFEAPEVAGAISEMLLICKICMNDILEQRRAIKKREELVESSVRGFVNGVFEKIGFAVGIAVETVVQTLIKFLF